MPLPDDEWSKQFGQFQGLLGPTDEEKKQAMNMGLLSAGLGILANNRGNYGAFGPAVGVGLQQGMQGYQHALQSGVEQREKGMANVLRMQEIQRLTRQGDIQNRRLDLDEKRLLEGKKGQAATAKMMLPGFLKSAGISGQGFDIDEDGQLVPVAMNETPGSIQPVAFDSSWMKEAGDDYKAMIAQGLQHPDKAVQRQAMNEAFKYYRESRQPAKADKVPSSVQEFRAMQAMPPDERAAYQDYLERKSPKTHVKVDNNISGLGQKEVAKSLSGKVDEIAFGSLGGAESGANAVRGSQDIYRALDSGKVLAGPLAKFRVYGAQLGNVLGIQDDGTLSNTRATIQALAQSTLSARGQLKGQGQVSDYEGKLIEKAASGNIEDMTTTEIRKVAEVNERMGRLLWDKHQKLLEKMKDDPAAQASLRYYQPDVPMPGPYKASASSHPATQADAGHQTFPAPNQAAINDLKLRRNDKAAQRDFDAAFGQGAAARVLGGK